MVEVKELYYYYKDVVTALKNISFVVPDGQIVGVFGENGAGKTTLLKNLAGILQPHENRLEIQIDGKNPKQLYHQLAYITGDGSFFPYMNPIEYGQFLADFFPSFDWEYYKNLLEFFQLSQKPMKQMSKGQKTKVELAAGMAKRAKYIIMDEPFTGKDFFTRKDFLKVMSGRLIGNETVFLCTHEFKEVENFIDRVMILHEGVLAADVTMDELRETEKTLEELIQEATIYFSEEYKKIFTK